MNNIKFQCNRCGTCCKWPGYVRLKDEEVAKIADFLKLEIETFTNEYTILTSDRRGLSLIEKDDHSCILFDEKIGCKINPVKPIQCKNFPLKWNFPDWEKMCKGERKIENSPDSC